MLTVADVLTILNSVPRDTKIWTCDSLSPGIILYGKNVEGIIHNDGTVDISDKIGDVWVKRVIARVNHD